MVRECDVVVTVSLHASNLVVLLKIEVFDQFKEKFLTPGHFLKTRKETLVFGKLHILQVSFHEVVVADVLNPVSLLGIRIKYFRYKVFALC